MLIGFRLQVVCLQPQACRFNLADVEFGADVGADCAGPDDGLVCAITEGKAQRTEDDGLASASLTGEHGHARLKFNFQGFDGGVILDTEVRQHRVTV